MFVLETVNSKMRNFGNPNFGSASPVVGRAARARGSQHRRRDATRAPKGGVGAGKFSYSPPAVHDFGYNLQRSETRPKNRLGFQKKLQASSKLCAVKRLSLAMRNIEHKLNVSTS